MRIRYLAFASLAAAAAIAGCGGSSNPDTAHLVPPPSASQTLTYSATTTQTTTTPTVTTPTSGPLSKEPKVTVPKSPAPTTLHSIDLIKGTGKVAAAGDSITANYVGVVYKTGKVFGASWSTGSPLTSTLDVDHLIPGWVEGIPGMRVGGRRELIIPPALAYKNVAQPGIPANSTLIFVIDLLAVTPASGATGASGSTGG